MTTSLSWAVIRSSASRWCSRASQQGLHLTPKQLFQHQTIAELAQVVTTKRLTDAEQGEVTGVVALTPIQHWFFSRDWPHKEHFNQAMMLQVKDTLDVEKLRQVISRLLQHHDALRMRYRVTTEGWQQQSLSIAEHQELPFTYRDLSALSDQDARNEIERDAEQANRSFNLEDKPLLSVTYFNLGAERGGRLLFIVHHLVMDGVSWRILLEDFQVAYEQLNRGAETIELPAKTTSYKSWAEHLVQYAQSGPLKAESEYWLKVEEQLGQQWLPVDKEGGSNRESSRQSIVKVFSQEQTKALLSEVSAAYHTQIQEVLLTALVEAIAKWTGKRQLVVQMEGHGREELYEEVDVTRTVGWFTSLYPLYLDATTVHGVGEVLKAIKEQVRAVPKRGVGYGIWKYLGTNEALVEREAEISFNYLGQFDQVLGTEGGMVQAAAENSGRGQSEEVEREQKLEVSGGVVGGVLQIGWTYSAEKYERETIDRLAQDYMNQLAEIIAHCGTEDAGGWTPSDFPLARLDQTTIDSLFGSDRNIESVYPLSPMQQGMFIHTLYSPVSWVYFNQVSFSLNTRLRVSDFKKAWQQVLDKNPILRTAFIGEELESPLQVVYKNVVLPVEEHDWSELSADEQQAQLEKYLQDDRNRGFDLSSAPLMRMTLIRMAEDVYQFILSHHHILLDGWSFPLLLNEAFSYYEGYRQGLDLRLPTRRPFRDYIGWLQQQDLAGAERFWREHLKGFTVPTPLPMQNATSADIEQNLFATDQLELSEESTQGLQLLGRRHKLTLNTIVQGAWALLLARYSGERDVLFGATVSGRPTELTGVETMLGLFINTLPVRVQIEEESGVAEWLTRLQQQQVEMRQYEYSPLVEVQGWSDVERGAGLFESIFVFENYPLEGLQGARAGTGAGAGSETNAMTISGLQAFEQSNYPLALLVEARQRMMLRIEYNRGRISDLVVKRMLKHLDIVLNEIIRDANQRVADIEMVTTDEREQFQQWNQTPSEYPADKCVHELFQEQAERTPDAIALRHEEQEMSYGELNGRANQLAHHLQLLGVRAENRVAICIDRSPEMVVGLLGILKAGGSYVPLDPDYPSHRLSFMLDDAEVTVVLTQKSLLSNLPERHVDKAICLDAQWIEISQQSRDNPQHGVYAENLAYIIYTSGSTGVPKGVGIPHRAIGRLVHGLPLISLDQRQVILQAAPLAFDASTFELWGALLHGGCSVLLKERIPTAERLREIVARDGVRTMWLTSALFNAVIDADEEAFLGVEQLVVGGEALSVGHVRRAVDRLKGVRLINGYGPTETTTFACNYEVRGVSDRDVSIPIGRGIGNTDVYVLSSNLQMLPVGVSGELCIGGAGLA